MFSLTNGEFKVSNVSLITDERVKIGAFDSHTDLKTVAGKTGCKFKTDGTFFQSVDYRRCFMPAKDGAVLEFQDFSEEGKVHTFILSTKPAPAPAKRVRSGCEVTFSCM